MNTIQITIAIILLIAVLIISFNVNWKAQDNDLFTFFKKMLLIAAISMVTLSNAHAQTRSGAYNRVVTDKWNSKTDESQQLTKWHNGTIKVSKGAIVIDSTTDKTQLFQIVKRSTVQDFCYDDVPDHYGIQFFTVIYTDKQVTKAMDGYFLLAKDKKTITDGINTYTYNASGPDITTSKVQDIEKGGFKTFTWKQGVSIAATIK